MHGDAKGRMEGVRGGWWVYTGNSERDADGEEEGKRENHLSFLFFF